MPSPIASHLSLTHDAASKLGRGRFSVGLLTGIVAGMLGALAVVELGLFTPSTTNYLADSNTTRSLETSISALRSDLERLESRLHGNEPIASGPSGPGQSNPATGVQPSKGDARSDATNAGNASTQPAFDAAKYDQIRANLQQMPFSRNYTLQDLTQEMATLPADRQRELLSELTTMMNNGQLRPEAVYRMR